MPAEYFGPWASANPDEVRRWTPLFTADQVAAAVDAERERCAKMCEREAQDWRVVCEPDIASVITDVADVIRGGDAGHKMRRS
jgi:hypothetical protein